jgi:hypothetical protein
VIEPQLENGLPSTHTRFYFPLSRAYYLEDMKVNDSKFHVDGMSEKIYFLAQLICYITVFHLRKKQQGFCPDC